MARSSQNLTLFVGWRAQRYLAPDTVSFANIEIYEPWDFTVVMQADGFLSYLNGMPHLPKNEVNQDGNISEALDTVVKGLGTLVDDYDYVAIFVDRTGYSDGTAYWNIPWHYKITGGSGTNYLFKNLQQLHKINAHGDMSLSKGGSQYTSKLNDPTTSWSQTNCQ